MNPFFAGSNWPSNNNAKREIAVCPDEIVVDRQGLPAAFDRLGEIPRSLEVHATEFSQALRSFGSNSMTFRSSSIAS